MIRILKPSPLANAKAVGNVILDGLHTLQAKHSCIGDVRGAGLFLGVEIVKDAEEPEPDHVKSLALVNALRRKNVLIRACGTHGQVLNIRLPLPFSRTNAAEFLTKLGECLDELGSGRSD